MISQGGTVKPLADGLLNHATGDNGKIVWGALSGGGLRLA